MGKADTGREAVFEVFEEPLHGVGCAGQKQVVIDLDAGSESGAGKLNNPLTNDQW